MNVVDGATVRTDEEHTYDVVVVGSGPAGATAARTLALGGARVVVVEEGPYVAAADCPTDSFSAMARLYRGLGMTVTSGNPPMPYLQGRVVGGTSVINGAISWRLPRDVYQQWVDADPALDEALGWDRLEEAFRAIEDELGIAPTEPHVAGRNNSLLAKGAEALGIEHRPIERNTRGCRGLGRCLQGCPEGRKQSMDVSYLPEASELGATIMSSARVTGIITDRGRAEGVQAITAAGGRLRLHGRSAVVLAASAVQTPALLLRSGVRQGPVGEHFQCHPGVSVAGCFDEPVRLWTGATQGHEAIGLRRQGIKFEALGYDLPIAAMRLKSFGQAFRDELGSLERWCQWGAAIRARGEGRVRARRRGGVAIRYSLTRQDIARMRRGVSVLGEMLLAAGASVVTPGVAGWHERVSDRGTMRSFAEEGPLAPKAYTMAATHLFGTCRMGSDPRTSVVGPDFRHHAVDGLYVADSSVFPSNTGVNPQTSIIALARLCGQRVLQAA